jgi:hypothetical protein
MGKPETMVPIEVLVRRGRVAVEEMGISRVSVMCILPYERDTPDGRVPCHTPFGWTAVSRAEFVRMTHAVSEKAALKFLEQAGLLDGVEGKNGERIPIRLVHRIQHKRRPK